MNINKRLSHMICMSLAARYVGPSWPAVFLWKMLDFEPLWFVFAWSWCGPRPTVHHKTSVP